jgi:hypothetical protein
MRTFSDKGEQNMQYDGKDSDEHSGATILYIPYQITVNLNKYNLLALEG